MLLLLGSLPPCPLPPSLQTLFLKDSPVSMTTNQWIMFTPNPGVSAAICACWNSAPEVSCIRQSLGTMLDLSLLFFHYLPSPRTPSLLPSNCRSHLPFLISLPHPSLAWLVAITHPGSHNSIFSQQPGQLFEITLVTNYTMTAFLPLCR